MGEVRDAEVRLADELEDHLVDILVVFNSIDAMRGDSKLFEDPGNAAVKDSIDIRTIEGAGDEAAESCCRHDVPSVRGLTIRWTVPRNGPRNPASGASGVSCGSNLRIRIGVF
jgi:hypothetical protein